MNLYEIENLPPNIYAGNVFCNSLVGNHHLKDSSHYAEIPLIAFITGITIPPNIITSNMTIAFGSTINLGTELLQIAVNVKH